MWLGIIGAGYNVMCALHITFNSKPSRRVENQSSLSLRLSSGDAARCAVGDGERERFWARAGDLEAERLLEREGDLHREKKSHH